MAEEDCKKQVSVNAGNGSLAKIPKLKPATHQAISASRNGCHHQSSRLWTEENDGVIQNLMIILINLQSTHRAQMDFNLGLFCLHCHSGTNPRVICLGCGAVYCLSNQDRKSVCYQIAHSTKLNKCHLGLDLICRELICMVCGIIIQPDEQELKLLNRRLFPQVKRSFAPGCLDRTTSNIFPPKGFRNLGNSCYMNVILQILLRIPEIQSYLLTDHHNRLKHRTVTQDEVYCCACELVEILQPHSGLLDNQNNLNNEERIRSYSSCDAVISPVGFLYSLWINSADGEDFAGYRESDAHECLLACLNQLHTTTQVPANPTPIKPPTSTPINIPTTPTATTTTLTAIPSINESTKCQCPIHLLFRCQLSSQLVCGHCGNLSEKNDPILDLSLEIQNLNHLQVLKLEDCLDNFTKCERLKEQCFTCNNCGVASPETTKSLTISKLPHILCIQLKRFEHSGSSSFKLDRHVKFPLVLNMHPYTSTTPHKFHNPELASSLGYYYKLTGIVKHQGNVSSGHYQAIVYQDEQYFCFNDGQVNILKLKEVLETEAYILVYSCILTESSCDF